MTAVSMRDVAVLTQTVTEKKPTIQTLGSRRGPGPIAEMGVREIDFAGSVATVAINV